MILTTVIILCLIENVINTNVQISYNRKVRKIDRKMSSAFVSNCVVPDVVDTAPKNIIKVIEHSIFKFLKSFDESYN